MKSKIDMSAVRNVLAYSVAALPVTTRTDQKMHIREFQVLRRACGCGKTRRELILNENIRKYILNGPHIKKWIYVKSRQWNGHITYTDKDKLIKIIQDNKPRGQISIGTPQNKWNDY